MNDGKYMLLTPQCNIFLKAYWRHKYRTNFSSSDMEE